MKTENIQADFQLVGHRILKLDLVNNFLSLENNEDLEREYELDYDIKDTNKTEKSIIGVIVLSVSCRVHDESGKEIRVDMAIEGCFYSQSLVSDEATFHEMLSINGSASLYSIARATIVSLTSQALYGGEVLLPMINTYKLKLQKEENEKTE